MSPPGRDGEVGADPQPAEAARVAGRPRDPRIDEVVLGAAATQLMEGGVRGLRMDALAERTGVAKTTIYRRWPSRSHLIAAVLQRGQEQVGTPSTGDVRADLVTLATRLAAVLEPPLMRQLVAELAAAVVQDPDLEMKVRRLWVDRRDEVAEILRRAVADGQLRADLEASVVVDQIAGALYYHVLVTGDPLSEGYATTLVDSVLRGALPR